MTLIDVRDFLNIYFISIESDIVLPVDFHLLMGFMMYALLWGIPLNMLM